MSDLQDIVRRLSPEERELLWLRLSRGTIKAQGVSRTIVPAPRAESGQAPLSFSQQRLWFLHQLDPTTPLYNIPVAIRIRGPLDPAALERSVNEVVRRHEAIRTTFSYIDDRPVQVITPALSVEIDCRDARGLREPETSGAIRDFCTSEARRPFDLTRGPLLRCALLRVADHEHILVVTMHHIISDGWSMGVLLYELTALYEAFVHGQPSPLSDHGVQYVDYALWQQGWVQSEKLKAQLAYWKEKLSGAPSLLALPATKPRPPVQGFNGAHHSMTVSPRLTAALKGLSQQKDVTLFMTLLAAFDVLLHRYTGQDDVLVGSPIANRNRSEVENLIGFFVNTLVFRSDLSGDPTFEELLLRVRHTATEGYAHQDLPFEKLVEELHPQRDLSHPPLIQVMFVLQNAPRPPLALPELTLELLDVDSGTAKFDLTLSIEETDRGLGAYYEYNTDLFDSQSIERLSKHFETLLASVVADPTKRISELSLVPEEERNRVLLEWCSPYTKPADDDFFQLRFEEQADRNPDAIAVAFEDRSLTYEELNRRANQLAHYLMETGVGPETLVGMCFDRSPEMIVALLAVLKAGGAYVPLDPRYPRERLAFMLLDSQVSLVLTQRDRASGLPAEGLRLICLDEEWSSISTRPTANPACRVRLENLAYIIYTSGTSGQPKGVQVTHRGICNLVDAEARRFGHGPGSRILQFASLSFDGATYEIVVTLGVGATLQLATWESLIPGPNLVAFLRERSITVAALPPSALAVLPEGTQLPSLNVLSVAGDRCPSDVVGRWAPGRRFFNLYGPTESTVLATAFEAVDSHRSPAIGKPIDNVQTYVLDAALQPTPIGVPGELHIGGIGLARGYLKRPDLTAGKFVPDPFGGQHGGRLYKTGDLVRYLPDGNIEFLGRIDHQVKIRGFRIELAEVESVLNQHPAVSSAVATLREDVPGDKRLVAYAVLRPEPAVAAGDLRSFLKERLPDFMVPSAVIVLETLPLSPNGKIDRTRLPAPETLRPTGVSEYQEPKDELERTISAIWKEVLRAQRVGANDNFFDIGGHSLLLAQVHKNLTGALKRDLRMVDLFKYPTVRALASYLAQSRDATGASEVIQHRGSARRESTKRTGLDIAIIGMSCRVPGARNVEELWKNLSGGVESISFFSDEQLEAAGVEAGLLKDPNYVKARGVIEKVDEFDASFFGFSPREAEIMDPQHRVFLECAWEALEDAGCDPERYPGAIGVYAGAGMNTYVLNLLQNRDVVNTVGSFQTMIGNGSDFLAPRVSYKFGLKGPSVSLQTACSTSLVATHMACQSILYGECDIALAGGVSVRLPQETGYFHQEGSIFSPDGHCRAFDASASGIVGGNGAGAVVLKLLSNALADGDHIYAVIKGSAVNNDGSLKVGFTAPGVDGQVKVISEALYIANMDPATVGYVEAHGTGTELGDPVEISALTQAFGARKGADPTCAIGSVKTNLGHLDAAAGVVGLIKASLALHHKQIPASLHFDSPNPKCEFENSPFYVNTVLRDWEKRQHPRRAGVSSLGIGGTNAHLVLEEAPTVGVAEDARPWHLLTLSAKSESATVDAALDLAAHLGSHSNLNLADVAYTLHVGRKEFEHRSVLIGSSTDEARQALESLDPQRVWSGRCASTEPSVAFMFPGQGAQHVEMGLDLYRNERSFRQQIDHCAEILTPILGLDVRSLLYPSSSDDRQRAADQLHRSRYAQPAVLTVEYALARLWMKWGVRPRAMIGHSLGTYAAACIAGVFSLEDVLNLVAIRGRLLESAPAGGMLSVPLSEKELVPLLPPDLSLSAINSPTHCVLAGPRDCIGAFQELMIERGVTCTLLHVSNASHSKLMDSILDPFAAAVRNVSLKPPKIPLVSNLSGDWITDDEATDPTYWARHLRGTVLFSDGVRKLLEEPDRLLLEVGPGTTLCTLAKDHTKGAAHTAVLASMRHPQEQQSDFARLLATLGKLWVAGARVNWEVHHSGENRRRVNLPTYPFQRQRYWIQPKDLSSAPTPSTASPRKKTDIADWFYVTSWKRSNILPLEGSMWPADSRNWLVFADESKLAWTLVERLVECGCSVTAVKPGIDFVQTGEREFTLVPGTPIHYVALLDRLRQLNQAPQRIVHMWTVQPRDAAPSVELNEQIQDRGFYCLLHLIQALGEQAIPDPLQIDVITNTIHDVAGEGVARPEAATVLGLCRVAPQEYPKLKCRNVDVSFGPGVEGVESLVEGLLAELAAAATDSVVALRDRYRWLQTFEQIKVGAASANPLRLRTGGVYLITGGLGGLGLSIASYLAQHFRAKLILTGRSPLPPRQEWDRVLENPADQESLHRKISCLREMEAAGAEVLPLSADVCLHADMQEVLRRAREQFGTIHGVIHAAGVTRGGMIQRKSREEAAEVLDPKVKGSLILQDLFKETPLDFLVLFSSLSSVLGEFGRVEICAASAFLDALSRSRSWNRQTRVISIDWDVWKDVGFAANAVVPPELKELHEQALEMGLTSVEGNEVFGRVLSRSGLDHVIVSTKDLTATIESIRSLTKSRLGLGERVGAGGRHARPSLNSTFVAPRTTTEEVIAEIWQDLLGIDKVGVDDNFFGLGGHSLLATQLVSRIREKLHFDVPLRSLFDSPTVAGLAQLVQGGTMGAQQDDLLTTLLSEIEGLSRDEVRAAISNEDEKELYEGVHNG